MSRYFSIGTTLAALLVVAALQDAHAEVSERVGYAYDKQTGMFLYSETHRELVRNGRLITNTVAYRDEEGRVFAEKHIDFRKSLVMPDFQLVNSENGHLEGARGGDKQLSVHFRRLSDSRVQKASVEIPGDGIIDAGFDRFIEQNWTALANGEILEREFLIPSQLEFYTFEIGKHDQHKAGELAFHLQIKSLFLQLFVPPVLVYYDAQTRSLLRYEGISNIRNDDGENFDVRIEFDRIDRVETRAGAYSGAELMHGRRLPGEQLATR